MRTVWCLTGTQMSTTTATTTGPWTAASGCTMTRPSPPPAAFTSSEYIPWERGAKLLSLRYALISLSNTYLYTYNIHLNYIHNIINSFITLVLDNFSVPQE